MPAWTSAARIPITAARSISTDWIVPDWSSIHANTVMAKVQYVTEHYAQLTPTAGPAQSVQTRWAAWSAEDAR